MSKHRNWVSVTLLAAALALFNAGTLCAQSYTISTATSQASDATGQCLASPCINGLAVAADAVGNVYLTGSYPAGYPAVFKMSAGNPPIGILGRDAPNTPQNCGAPATEAAVNNPHGLAVDSGGNLYVAEGGGGPILFVSGGIDNCKPDSNASFGATGVVADNLGNIYFSLSDSHVVCEVTSSGQLQIIAGKNAQGCTSGGIGGCSNGEIGRPFGLALDATGNLYIADAFCNTIWKVTPPPRILSFVAGVPGNTNGDFTGDGPATSVWLNSPMGVAVDPGGNLFIADTSNQLIREVTSGVMTHIAGQPKLTGASGNCQPALSAMLSGPSSVAVGPGGIIYVGETGTNRIRQLTPQGTELITISPPPGTVLLGTTAAFSWCVSSATQYELDVGDNPLGQGDIFKSGATAATSVNVPNIPCDGRTIYVQLSAFVNGQWQTPSEYTYTACKMLNLSLSPSQLPLQGGAATCSIQVESPSGGTTETAQLFVFMMLQTQPCGRRGKWPLPPYPTSLTLSPNVPQTVSYTKVFQALQQRDLRVRSSRLLFGGA
jgi:hypothetical protein